MRFLVSCSDSGSLKEVVCNQNTDTSVLAAPQPLHVESHLTQGLKNEIDQICEIAGDCMLVGRRNGALELVKTTRVPKTYEEEGEAKPIFDITNFEIIHKLDGLLNDSKLEPLFQKSKRRTKQSDSFIAISKLPNYDNDYLVSTRSGLLHIIRVKDNKELHLQITHEVKAPLEFATVFDNVKIEDKTIIAYGGEENPIKLIELNNTNEELNQIWEAKNVANDRLDMRVPVWPTGLQFLNPQQNPSDKSKLNYQFVCVTRWGHLGVYVTQHGRKPLHYIDLLPNREPLTRLAMVGNLTKLGNLNETDINNFTFVTPDTKKDIWKFNEKGRLLGKYGKGDIVGASTFVTITNNKYLLAGGLDRYLRVYNVTSCKLIAKVYVRSKVNFIKMLDDEDILIPTPAAIDKQKTKRKISEETEDDAEDLWEKLETRAKKVQKNRS
ncbi:hypothetical protein KAFR_0G03450 [Kazachstania africana CBS 2517]|uniref:Ribosome biogenesis protein NSA1 n=1 Tax=Kazachstania africana (strain ATCC 22294 / BCRC 22015 / CBS 2517 / CECT 1963 / NBRC 1671 / NRRL Y-8276) TaxID=1071382 RepID=H2AYC7_KAZAF|nr:hypothetical protein KAFR_0G03450 [Kazachstania africana CBS 2517]CCF59377.1 hypothetical protein KAFR_0G03450 [Kazachstania africana CBS 2517]